MEILEGLGAFGIGILLAISVAGLFWKLDDAIAEMPRLALSKFLQRLSAEPPHPHIPETVASAFDHIFGKKHISWRCALMSTLFSIMAVAALTLVYARIHGEALNLLEDTSVRPFFIVISIFALSLNLLPDYISLLETRIIVKLMCRSRSYLITLGYLFLDAALTYLIFSVLGSLFLFSSLLMSDELGNQSLIEVAFDVAGMRAIAFSGDGGGFLGIFLYSTYFTSVWVWLTALGWGAMRLMAMAPPLLGVMQYLLPIEQRPLRSIGEVAALIVCLGYWGISAISWIASTSEAQAALGN